MWKSVSINMNSASSWKQDWRFLLSFVAVWKTPCCSDDVKRQIWFCYFHQSRPCRGTALGSRWLSSNLSFWVDYSLCSNVCSGCLIRGQRWPEGLQHLTQSLSPTVGLNECIPVTEMGHNNLLENCVAFPPHCAVPLKEQHNVRSST